MRRATVSVVGAVALRPWLWPVALTQVLRLARPGWWHRWPPVPTPEPSLWRFRLETAYGGDGESEPVTGDIRTFLGWCRDMRYWRRR